VYGFAPKGRKGSRERDRRCRFLGFQTRTDQTTTERPESHYPVRKVSSEREP
jgi:hypothetical protein